MSEKPVNGEVSGMGRASNPKTFLILRRAALWAGVATAVLVFLLAVCLGAIIYRPQLLWPLAQKAVAAAGGTVTALDVQLSLSPMCARVENLDLKLPAITATLAHGAVYPDFSAKRRGRPLIRLVEVKGLKAEIRPSPKKRKKLEAPPDISGLKRIFEIGEARISDCEITMAAGGGKFSVSGLSAGISPGPGDTRTLKASALCQWTGTSPAQKAYGPVFVSGSLENTPVMTGRVNVDGLNLTHPGLSGKVTASANFILKRDGLFIPSIKADVPAADVKISRKAGWKAIPLELDAKGAYPFKEAPEVIVSGLTAGGFISLEGRSKGLKPADLSASFRVTVSDVSQIISGIGSMLPGSARPLDPKGALVLTAAVEKGKARVSVNPFNFSGRVSGFSVSGLSARLAATGPIEGPASFSGNIEASWTPDPSSPKSAPVAGRASLALAGEVAREGFEINISPASARVEHKGDVFETASLSASAQGPLSGPYEWKTDAAIRTAAGKSPEGPVGPTGAINFSASGKAGRDILDARADIRAANAVFRGIAASVSGKVTALREGKKPIVVNGDMALALAPAKNRGRPGDLPPASGKADIKVSTTTEKFSLKASLKGLSAESEGLILAGAGTLGASGPVSGPYGVNADFEAMVKPGRNAGAKNNFQVVDAKARASVTGIVTKERFSAKISLMPLEGAMKEFSGKISGNASASGPFKGPFKVAGKLEAAMNRADSAKPAGMSMKATSVLSFNGSAGKDRLALDLTAENFSAELPGIAAKGAARVAVKGPASAKASVSGKLTALADITKGQLAAKGLTLAIPVTGTIEAPAVKGFSLGLPKGGLLLKGKALDLGRASAGGDIFITGKNIAARNLAVKTERLGRIIASGSFVGGKPAGKFSAKGLTVERLVETASAFTTLPVKGWALAGPVELSGGIAQNGVISVKSALSDLSLSSPDGQIMGQSIEIGLDAKTSLEENPPVTLSLAAQKGEFLFKTLYLDFSKLPVSAKASGRPLGASGIKGLDFSAGVGNLGLLKVRGDLSKAGKDLDFSGRLNVDRADVTGIWTSFIKDTLAASRPDMAGTTLTGGADLACDIAMKGGIADVKGRLSLRGIDLSQEKGANISGLNLDLPLSYRFGARGPELPETMPDWGRLAIKKLVAGPVDAGPYALSVALLKNRFWVKEEIIVPLFGSNLTLSGIRVNEPLSPGFTARLSAVLGELDMAKLPSGMPLEGKIGGTLSPIVATRQRVTIGGGLSGSFFGGKMTVRDLSVADPLGMGRTIGADVAITGVDLKPFTTALGAGLILGSVDISAKNVAIAQGQPVAFNLAVNSVRKKGVSQKVTLEAVNSIAVVSSGSGLTGMGVSLMTKVFEAFPYEAMGFSCTLRNDTFSVRGLVREGGTEYLVKRPLIRGINVINRNLENKISFSDMLERIQRVRGGGKGPDVKVGG